MCSMYKSVDNQTQTTNSICISIGHIETNLSAIIFDLVIMMLSILLLLCSFALKFSEAGTCPNTWTDFGGSCYKLIEEKVSWYEAQVICVTYNSQMIKIDSKAEDDFAVAWARKLGVSLWIGLSDFAQEGSFVLDGTLQTPSYTHWGPGEPNNHAGVEDCALMWDSINYFWNDAPCYNKYSTMCEKKRA